MKFDYGQFRADIIDKRHIQSNLTLREAGKKIGISSATLSRLENNNLPDLLTYARVCKWLNTPLEKYLINGKVK